MTQINYPKVGVTKDKKAFIVFFVEGKRFRLFNGKRINSSTAPNKYPENERLNVANLLAAEVYNYIKAGGVLNEYRSDLVVCGKLSDIDYLQKALDSKLKGNYSKKYKSMLKFTLKKFLSGIKTAKIEDKDITAFLDNYNSTSYNTMKRHLSAIVSEAIKIGMPNNPMSGVNTKISKANLNKPFDNVGLILDEIKDFNFNLYLCCILTYGCLLRPHREVRELTWSDFSQDLSIIKLSGSRNKSGRNRIVPVPQYVQELLVKGEPNCNIFSGTTKPLNPDYFKTLWGRFKKVSKLLEQDQTLYSFRHSGAINIYKRTGSLSKLQKAMGHSNMMVSMTYLRGLEISELEESDMPVI